MAPKKRTLLETVAVEPKKATPTKAATRRRLKRRDTDEQVKEALTRQLGDADDIDLHHRIVDGVTLHDTMVEYKRLSKVKGAKKGLSL
jgi:hypothetical protein